MNTSASPPKVQGRILVENVRFSFTDGIWAASTPKGTTGEPAFNVQAILPMNHPQMPALSALIAQAAQKQWKGQAIGPNGQPMPEWQAVLQVAQAAGKIFLRNGNTKKYEGYAGNYFIACRSKTRPKVYDGMENGKPREVHKREDSRIYSGCYGNLLIDVFPYTRGSNGIGAGFKAIQFVKDGEPLGGSAPAQADEMGVVEESAAAAAEFGALFGVTGPAGSVGFQL